jgi:hypothetical protein
MEAGMDSEFAGMIGGVTSMIVIGWIIKAFLANGRHKRVLEAQKELQNQLLQRFDSTSELTAFLGSDSGERFLKSATIEGPSPFSRILSSVQAGIILALAGIACLALHPQLPEAEEGLLVLGALGLAFGMGFLISGFVAYWLSRSWGILNGRDGWQAESGGSS